MRRDGTRRHVGLPYVSAHAAADEKLNVYRFAFDSLWLTSLEENAIIRIDIDRVDLSTGR